MDDRLLEALAEAAHEAWVDSKWHEGIRSIRSEWGEELMTSYDQLSEHAKDVNRAIALGILAALKPAGYVVMRAWSEHSMTL